MSLEKIAHQKMQRGKRTDVDAIDLDSEPPAPSPGDLYNRDSPTLGPSPQKLWARMWAKEEERQKKRARRLYDRDRKKARKL